MRIPRFPSPTSLFTILVIALCGSIVCGCPIWSRYMNNYGMLPYGGGYGYNGAAGMGPYGMGMGMGMGMPGAGMGMGVPGYGYGMTAGSVQYPYIDPQVYWMLAGAPRKATLSGRPPVLLIACVFFGLVWAI